LGVDAPAAGYALTSLAGYLALSQAEGGSREPEVLPPSALRLPTSWSCPHGVARWDDGCSCTPGDSSWKLPLRWALRRLATRLDAIFEAESASALRHPWLALESYLDLRDGAVAPASYWSVHAQRKLRTADALRLGGLLEMQFMRQAMFVSCAWFFDDLDRLEPRIALAHAHRAITLAARHSGADLGPGFAADLAASRSARTGRSAADIYHEFAQAVADVA
ncbi:MAG TPA: DUF3536 domain-containing protein, partial [Chloroflexota bacterium]|nr:DUF3536 domain-containing protein [Chloroflexota bacterium]